MYIPTRMFLTRGVGVDKDKLASFEMALRNAKISQFNLVSVSSIFPPNCKLIPRSKGVKLLQPGQIVHCVLSRTQTDEPYRRIASSVGLAVPRDKSKYGYISEHHSFGKKAQQAGDYAEDIAAYMLATILGVKFDSDKSYDEQKEIWKISGEIVHSDNVTQIALGDKNGKWTCVVAAAVFVP
jgi:arginine decarboxylase